MDLLGLTPYVGEIRACETSQALIFIGQRKDEGPSVLITSIVASVVWGILWFIIF